LCRSGVLLRLVDPHRRRQRGWFGWLADEALWVLGVGSVEDLGPLGSDELGAAVVHVGGRVEPDAGVAVVVVVPAKELCAEGVRVLIAAEALGKLGSCLELQPSLSGEMRNRPPWSASRIAAKTLGESNCGQQ
jgi:hypothetical protein